MSDQNHCKICKSQAETIPSNGFDLIHQKCRRCGEFKLAGTACATIPQYDEQALAKISGWIYDQNKNRTVPTIATNVLKQVASRHLPTISERADRFLLEALRRQNKLGGSFDISEERFIAATYSQDTDEVRSFLQMLSNKNLMKTNDLDENKGEILLDGYIRVDDLTRLTRRPVQSDKGFVAMSFNKELDSAYENGFQVGILDAGYDPVRVDRLEHVNRIDDEIIAQIRAASFIVADFTDHRGGVYFEAGFALGLDLPVIWTCHKDDMKDLHFDIRQYNTIDWKDPDDLSSRLQNRIEATVGKGPNHMELK